MHQSLSDFCLVPSFPFKLGLRHFLDILHTRSNHNFAGPINHSQSLLRSPSKQQTSNHLLLSPIVHLSSGVSAASSGLYPNTSSSNAEAVSTRLCILALTLPEIRRSSRYCSVGEGNLVVTTKLPTVSPLPTGPVAVFHRFDSRMSMSGSRVIHISELFGISYVLHSRSH